MILSRGLFWPGWADTGLVFPAMFSLMERGVGHRGGEEKKALKGGSRVHVGAQPGLGQTLATPI